MAKMRYAPLSAGFMAVSILGFLISVWLIADWSEKWAFSFAFIFVIMFIASLISMTKAEPLPEHMEHLAIHERSKQGTKKYREKPVKIDKFVFNWRDLAFLVFIIVGSYYFFEGISKSTQPVSPFLFLAFLTIGIILIIFFIVEVITSERIAFGLQALFVILLLLTGPLGLFVYYVYRRIHRSIK